MALYDTKTPYELLIRYGIDGQPKGAHCRYLVSIRRRPQGL